MWILIVGNLFSSIWRIILAIVMFIICFVSFFSLTIEKNDTKYIFNKFICIDVLLNAIAINYMGYIGYYDFINLLFFIDVFFIISTLLLDLRNKYNIKDKLHLIAMHFSGGYLLYIIFEIIMEIIFLIIGILGFIFNPLIDIIANNSISDNIILVVAIIGFIILSIPSIIILFIIIEIIRFFLSPILFLLGDGDYNNTDFVNTSQSEYIIDQYNQKCEIVNKLPSGGSFEDSHGEWHDIYGSSEYGYYDEDGNHYYN